MTRSVGDSVGLEGHDLLGRILEVLASIEACDLAELIEKVAQEGLDGVRLTSHQVVHILVALQEVTGVDPEDPNVLKDCNPQTLQDLTDFLSQGGSSP